MMLALTAASVVRGQQAAEAGGYGVCDSMYDLPECTGCCFLLHGWSVAESLYLLTDVRIVVVVQLFLLVIPNQQPSTLAGTVVGVSALQPRHSAGLGYCSSGCKYWQNAVAAMFHLALLIALPVFCDAPALTS